ncbi:MAG: glycosyltransferase family 2 protein [Candidatus Hydrogenedentes bacterium]|nr:glycosyltransferase family 2 protein [Candidatus Hydrogenedentota bacterium]
MTTRTPANTPPDPHPRLSVVIPAYNEAMRIEATLVHLQRYLDKQDYSSEIIVVDDGSTDATFGIVRNMRTPSRIPVRIHQLPENRGKGAAVKAGMAGLARGAVRLFYDADASTPIEELEKVWPALEAGADVVIGSRALPDSRVELHQAPYREFLGRVFNRLLKLLRLTAFLDTQCGFKAFTAEAAEQVFPRQTLEGFSFDVELLFIAARAGLDIREVPVRWINSPASRVNPVTDSARMFRDVFLIHYRNWQGRYSQ